MTRTAALGNEKLPEWRSEQLQTIAYIRAMSGGALFPVFQQAALMFAVKHERVFRLPAATGAP